LYAILLIPAVLIGGAFLSSSGDRILPLVIGGAVAVFPAFHRFRNIGYNPWWTLLSIVIPFAYFAFAYLCLTRQEGYVYERRLDRTGRIVRLIFALVGGALLILLIYAVAFGPDYSSVGTPNRR